MLCTHAIATLVHNSNKYKKCYCQNVNRERSICQNCSCVVPINANETRQQPMRAKNLFSN